VFIVIGKSLQFLNSMESTPLPFIIHDKHPKLTGKVQRNS
jgi:hypothetical protein